MKSHNVTKTLSFRIAFPVIIILLLAYIIIYIFVLRNISIFALKTIEATMEEMEKDLYEYCDEAISRLIKEGQYNPQRVLIAKAEVLEKIERFMENNELKGFIKEEDHLIFISDDLKEKEILKIKSSKELSIKELGNKKYYISSISFQPWRWEIFILNEKDIMKTSRERYICPME